MFFSFSHIHVTLPHTEHPPTAVAAAAVVAPRIMATASPPPNPDVPLDPKSYYGYLFQPDKAPTPLFDTLLRAIAQHIVGDLASASFG